jgi:hypothetical protein
VKIEPPTHRGPEFRDPLVDPAAGDLVYGMDGRMALVLNVNLEDDDLELGPRTVHVREDTKWGSRSRVTMRLEGWRRWAKGGSVYDPALADTFNKGGMGAVFAKARENA